MHTNQTYSDFSWFQTLDLYAAIISCTETRLSSCTTPTWWLHPVPPEQHAEKRSLNSILSSNPGDLCFSPMLPGFLLVEERLNPVLTCWLAGYCTKKIHHYFSQSSFRSLHVECVKNLLSMSKLSNSSILQFLQLSISLGVQEHYCAVARVTWDMLKCFGGVLAEIHQAHSEILRLKESVQGAPHSTGTSSEVKCSKTTIRDNITQHTVMCNHFIHLFACMPDTVLFLSPAVKGYRNINYETTNCLLTCLVLP